jgi:hypothetical protein
MQKKVQSIDKFSSLISDVDAFVTTYPTITIQAGAALSDALDLGRDILAGLIVPAAVDATTAQVSFWGSDTLAGTYYQVKQGGTKLVLPIAVNDFGLLTNAGDLFGVRFVKIQLETAAGAAVNQVASKTFQAIKVAAF